MEDYRDYSLRERVFHKIQEDILKGCYKEGEELRELTLSKELGVSRTPVREALRQLELEGLVNIIPNKGAYVQGINGKDVKDIYIIRSLLEGLCARWATEHMGKEQIDRMEEIVLLSEFHLEKGDDEQVVKLDGEFHKLLYEAMDSRILEHIMTELHQYVKMARKTSVGKADRAEKSVREHKGILEAIKKKDADYAEKLANAHVMHVMENLGQSNKEEHAHGED